MQLLVYVSIGDALSSATTSDKYQLFHLVQLSRGIIRLASCKNSAVRLREPRILTMILWSLPRGPRSRNFLFASSPNSVLSSDSSYDFNSSTSITLWNKKVCTARLIIWPRQRSRHCEAFHVISSSVKRYVSISWQRVSFVPELSVRG